jgi:hypothetical protein
MIPETEAFTSFEDLQRTIRKARDLFVVPFPSAGPALQYRTALYGVPTVNGPIKSAQPVPQRYGYTLTVEELI